MRRLNVGLGVMAALLFVAGVSAQNKKDFTGKWTLDADKSGSTAPNPGGGGRAGGRGGGNLASDFEIKMDDKSMNVMTDRNGTMSTVSYKLDGSDSKNPGSMRGGAAGQDEISNAKWDGDKLVITNKTTNVVTSYWLDGGDLVRESVRPGRDGSPGQPARTYFKKKM